MELKKYQQISLDKLEDFLKYTSTFGPKMAFINVTEQPYKSEYFGEDIPFICIKIPTGGGKTFVASHSIGKIYDNLLKNKLDRGIVMWFVPSDAILSQTLKKLKDKKDPHRAVLDEAFDNKVMVFSNEEALRIRKSDVDNYLCIIVSTLDAFRKEKNIQNKYKVYQENGALIDHFQEIDDSKMLEKDESGVINSLANVIRLSNPLIILDEGHRAKTNLSFEILKNLNPSFVIEYTATPRLESNVLVEVHSSELKDENMVKLPLVLERDPQWMASINQGIAKREELEKEARLEKGKKIRPIALIQAEQEKEDNKKITVSRIKEFLLNETQGRVKEEEIAIKTSKENELEGVDLFDNDCKIRYIITVNALAEGWDCSFAYILISVANIGSRVAVEQIIGRIMRLPFAKKLSNENLNRSYVFASAKNFNEAADEIIKGLEDNGYSRLDLVNATESRRTYSFEANRRVNEDFEAPVIAYENTELSFEDLIGKDFRLSDQEPSINFEIFYDNSGRAIIDIKEGDQWFRGKQTFLKVVYEDKNLSKNELVQWLDKKLRFTVVDKEDKVKFLNKVIDSIKKYSLQELSINRFLLLDKISDLIEKILVEQAKKNFDSAMKNGKLTVRSFEKFPETITLSNELPEEFNKNYYNKIDKLNGEERRFIERLDLDTLPNIKFWVRNRERQDSFYLQGWRRDKFYPDFIAVTNKGNILALEWKGEHLLTNEDTQYKEELGRIWEKLGKGKTYFFLISNKNVDKTLNKIKVL
ncbi:MAG: DEAD/DEAH box helicase family protein [Candidatus Parvarchaeota archaeon]|nr:DEAD/DEAH box helicase family protein [Candidatus Parvarchaeum tengchongense]MCW1298822.1 DEAD/DEAH box helicase family protein [Candidatus Parvarchaeum tengchongense]MCW1312514.1 DEAD/DEAH box helicase family protein [Candidatus Parvarchaeum tengchongense]